MMHWSADNIEGVQLWVTWNLFAFRRPLAPLPSYFVLTCCCTKGKNTCEFVRASKLLSRLRVHPLQFFDLVLPWETFPLLTIDGITAILNATVIALLACLSWTGN